MGNPQIFCFTYAGGNASFFDSLANDLSAFELVRFEYAGHGTRHKEPFYRSFDELADDLYGLLKKQYTGDSYALLGYSMGTIALIEVLKRILAQAEIAPPDHIFLAAHEPHSRPELAGFRDDELDEWIKDRTVRFGGVPDKLLHNRSFWRMYLPLFRADYSLLGKYRFEDLNLSVGIPATVFYSETDTPLSEMTLWKRYFTGKCDFCQHSGTHFFIQEHHEKIAEVIASSMR